MHNCNRGSRILSYFFLKYTERILYMSNTTPYDNAYKTLCVDCPQLLIPLVNEAFHEHYGSVK